MAPRASDDDQGDDLPPSEAARARRRDHDAAAPGRAGMRTGLAKQFKQVLDAQVRRARAARPDVPADPGDEDASPGPPPKKRGHPARRPHGPVPPG